MTDSLRIALESHRRIMTEVSKATCNETTTEVSTLIEPDHRPSIMEQNRQRRFELYRQVTGLLHAGVSQSDAARQLDISLRTVQRWARVVPSRNERRATIPILSSLMTTILISGYVKAVTT